jgi:hypothetical protein
MDTADSAIFRLASVGSYLDALASITDEMSLRERSNLIFLDKCLHEHWGLGENVLLNWSAAEDGIEVLVVPNYIGATYATTADDKPVISDGMPSESFFRSLLSGLRQLDSGHLHKVGRLLGLEPTFIPLRISIANSAAQQNVVERMIKRYSISYTASRAVALFDIVGFGLLTPFQQMCQLNSLSYSLNSAQSKLSGKSVHLDLARTTTGDGFYVWTRDQTLDSSINLFHFLHLALADNAIARSKSEGNTVPRLRACFQIGSSYEFPQAEGLSPTIYNYIVGDVTIELARMIEGALPGQILVGDFKAEMPFLNGDSPGWVTVDSIDFVARATHRVAQLRGMELSGERVDVIRTYLTGARLNNGEFTVRRISIKDKHGISRIVYNAKANIYRQTAEAILLGKEDKDALDSMGIDTSSAHVVRDLRSGAA